LFLFFVFLVLKFVSVAFFFFKQRPPPPPNSLLVPLTWEVRGPRFQHCMARPSVVDKGNGLRHE